MRTKFTAVQHAQEFIHFMLKTTNMLNTVALGHGICEVFLRSLQADALQYIKCKHQYTLIILSQTHITLLSPFHVAAGSSTNSSYSNLPSVSSTSFSSLYCS